MPFNNQVIGSLAQTLGGLSTSAARTILLKHRADVPEYYTHSEDYLITSGMRLMKMIGRPLFGSLYNSVAQLTPRKYKRNASRIALERLSHLRGNQL